MGNVKSQPTNKTGKKVIQQKLEHAKKTGILSLQEHKLNEVPSLVFSLSNLRTLDLSKNNLSKIDDAIGSLKEIKILHLDENKLTSGKLEFISNLKKLQNLSVGGNKLGMIASNSGGANTLKPSPNNPLPTNLPKSLKQVKLNSNMMQTIPKSILSSDLAYLEKLDLSNNDIASVPPDIKNLASSLVELNLDKNLIVALPDEIGQLKKLKVLSLKNNKIHVETIHFSPQNPQPLPSSLFTETLVIDLNLHGNRMTNKQIQEFEGFNTYLERRKSVKSKNLYGGALTDLDVCGLE